MLSTFAKMFNLKGNNDSSPKVDIQIQLHDVRTYRSRDHVDGVVILTAVDATDTPFGKLDIELIGISTFTIRTLSLATGIPHKLQHYERFLELEEPNATNHMPIDRVLAAGVQYEIPFHFTVPDRILPTACAHEGQIREQHTRLPPTLDDSGEDFDHSYAGDATIRYRVVARLWQARDAYDNTQKALIAIKGLKLKILPSISDERQFTTSPLNEHVLYQEISLKNKLSAKHNRLSISAIEPASLRLPFSESARKDADSTILPITLHFDGEDEFARPPRLGKLKINVQVETFLRSTSQNDNHWIQSHHPSTETIDLPPRSAANIVWYKHCLGLGDCDVHGTLSSAASPATVDPSSKKRQLSASNECSYSSCYRANITIPVVLRQINSLVPTFQTCSIWRRYRLIFRLDVYGMSLGRARTTVLQIPLHISTQTSTTSQGSDGISSDLLIDRCRNRQLENGICIGNNENLMAESSLALDELPEYVAREYCGRGGYQNVRTFR